MDQIAEEFYVLTYDTVVPDWPGELDFYREMAKESHGGSLLEIACGTGRLAIRLAQSGLAVVGLDLSAEMIAMARRKSAGLENIRWIEADMRSFDLKERFALVIIPGHSFQFLSTPQDQLACLACLRQHLAPGGRLVIHLDPPDIPWLAGLCGEKSGVFEPAGQFQHPITGRQVRTLRAWSYQPSTQTASALTVWEELDLEGQVVNRIERGPIRLHCVFPFEMEHLLSRAGFAVEALFGDFHRQEFQQGSSDMIWVAS
jgi:SAM-dependent methyltransferase